MAWHSKTITGWVPTALWLAVGSVLAGGCGDAPVQLPGEPHGSDDSDGSGSGGPLEEGTTAVEPPDASGDEEGSSTGEPPLPVCGDGVIDPGEECDGAALGGETCATAGWPEAIGPLACSDECLFDTSGCYDPPTCGNGIAEPGEECDGDDLDGESCQTLGWDDAPGSLRCTEGCTFDTRECSASCGNGVIEGLEICDGDALGEHTCASLGLGAGTLACTPGCELDASACCGDGTVAGEEACDGDELDGTSCEDLGFSGGTLACDATCGFDDAGCSVCGNGLVEDGEACDGDDLDRATCVSVVPGSTGGTLACTEACGFDTSACHSCGNGLLDPGEACELGDLLGQTCLGLGFAGGELACDASCALDLGGCFTPAPGDLVISEIMPGAPWFELHNPTAQDWPLQGCGVEGFFAFESFTIDAALVVPAGGRVVLAGAAAPGVVADHVIPGGFGLQANGDVVRLRCSGLTVDQVVYDDLMPWPGPLPGVSLSLDPGSLDASLNDDGLAWCHGVAEYAPGLLGSPGAPNPAC